MVFYCKECDYDGDDELIFDKLDQLLCHLQYVHNYEDSSSYNCCYAYCCRKLSSKKTFFDDVSDNLPIQNLKYKNVLSMEMA